jgi:hypothetical protein
MDESYSTRVHQKTFENESPRKIVGLSTIDDVTGDRQIDIPQVKVKSAAGAAARAR